MTPVTAPQTLFEKNYGAELKTVTANMKGPSRPDVAATFAHPFVDGRIVMDAPIDEFNTLAQAKATGRARPGPEVVLRRPEGGFSLHGAKVERFLACDKLRSGLSGVKFERFAPDVEAILHEGGAAKHDPLVTEFSRDSLQRLNVIRLLMQKQGYGGAINATRMVAEFDPAVAHLAYHTIISRMADTTPYEARPILKEYRRLLGNTKDPVAKNRYWSAFWDVDRAITKIEKRNER